MRSKQQVIEELNIVINELSALKDYNYSNDIERFGGLNPIFDRAFKKGILLVVELLNEHPRSL